MKIISSVLIVVVAVLSFKHGWDSLKNTSPQGDAAMFSWGISKPVQVTLSVINILVALMILFPQTFFAGNMISAMVFVLLIGFQLKSGNIRAALIEIPFLLMPCIMIFLGHPLKNNF